MKHTFGDFLRKNRIKFGLSQKEVAVGLGYTTPQFISNWERGLSNPPINSIRKLGHLYKLKEEDLFEMYLNSVLDEVTEDLKRKFYGRKEKRN